MFTFNYTTEGIARFNAIKDNTETRVTILGTLIGEDLMGKWYRRQIENVSARFRFDDEDMFWEVEVQGVGCFLSKGMSGDSHNGVCEDHDVRCIRIIRMKRDGEMPYGPDGMVFKKKAGDFMSEIIRDSGVEYTDDERSYICCRFAVEWMEARILQFGTEALNEPVNNGVKLSAEDITHVLRNLYADKFHPIASCADLDNLIERGIDWALDNHEEQGLSLEDSAMIFIDEYVEFNRCCHVITDDVQPGDIIIFYNTTEHDAMPTGWCMAVFDHAENMGRAELYGDGGAKIYVKTAQDIDAIDNQPDIDSNTVLAIQDLAHVKIIKRNR